MAFAVTSDHARQEQAWEAVQGSYKVVKNTLAKRALKGTSFEALATHFEGTTAVAYTGTDPVGLAKTHTFDRRPLEPIDPTVIPAGHLYVQGTSPDSFDSRYSLAGLVRVQDVKSRVIPLL